MMRYASGSKNRRWTDVAPAPGPLRLIAWPYENLRPALGALPEGALIRPQAGRQDREHRGRQEENAEAWLTHSGYSVKIE